MNEVDGAYGRLLRRALGLQPAFLSRDLVHTEQLYGDLPSSPACWRSVVSSSARMSSAPLPSGTCPTLSRTPSPLTRRIFVRRLGPRAPSWQPLHVMRALTLTASTRCFSTRPTPSVWRQKFARRDRRRGTAPSFSGGRRTCTRISRMKWTSMLTLASAFADRRASSRTRARS